MHKLTLLFPHNGQVRESLHVSLKAATLAKELALGQPFKHWPPRASISRTNEKPIGEMAPL